MILLFLQHIHICKDTTGMLCRLYNNKGSVNINHIAWPKHTNTVVHWRLRLMLKLYLQHVLVEPKHQSSTSISYKMKV